MCLLAGCPSILPARRPTCLLRRRRRPDIAPRCGWALAGAGRVRMVQLGPLQIADSAGPEPLATTREVPLPQRRWMDARTRFPEHGGVVRPAPAAADGWCVGQTAPSLVRRGTSRHALVGFAGRPAPALAAGTAGWICRRVLPLPGRLLC